MTRASGAGDRAETAASAPGGKGPPEALLLLPGLMCDARLWWGLLPLLSACRPLVLMPLPVVADTVTDMAQAALAQAPQRFALAGMGLGGVVALEMLRQAPGRVHRIALMGADPLPEMPTAAAEREVLIATARAGRLDEVLAREYPPDVFAPGSTRLEVQGIIRSMGNTLGREAYMRQARALQRRPDQQRTLRSANLPGLVLSGAHDAVVPLRRQQFTADMLPRARFVRVEGAGHFLPLEAPGALARALDEWLALPSGLG